MVAIGPQRIRRTGQHLSRGAFVGQRYQAPRLIELGPQNIVFQRRLGRDNPTSWFGRNGPNARGIRDNKLLRFGFPIRPQDRLPIAMRNKARLIRPRWVQDHAPAQGICKATLQRLGLFKETGKIGAAILIHKADGGSGQNVMKLVQQHHIPQRRKVLDRIVGNALHHCMHGQRL